MEAPIRRSRHQEPEDGLAPSRDLAVSGAVPSSGETANHEQKEAQGRGSGAFGEIQGAWLPRRRDHRRMVRRKAQGEDREGNRLRQLARPRNVPPLRVPSIPEGRVQQKDRDTRIRMHEPRLRKEVQSLDRDRLRLQEDTDLGDDRVPVPPVPVPQLDVVRGVEHERRLHRALPRRQAVFGRRWHPGGNRLRRQGLDRREIRSGVEIEKEGPSRRQSDSRAVQKPAVHRHRDRRRKVLGRAMRDGPTHTEKGVGRLFQARIAQGKGRPRRSDLPKGDRRLLFGG